MTIDVHAPGTEFWTEPEATWDKHKYPRFNLPPSPEDSQSGKSSSLSYYVPSELEVSE